jgi:hypothetical protein
MGPLVVLMDLMGHPDKGPVDAGGVKDGLFGRCHRDWLIFRRKR